MKEQHPFFGRRLSRFLTNTPSFDAVIFLSLILTLLFACAGPMSVDEAKQVTLSMSKESFVPPPRRIDDILAVLDEPGQFDREIAAITQAKADEPPPDTDDQVTLAEFYLERGIMAREIGRPKQALADHRTALKYAEDETGRKVAGMSNKFYSKILLHVGHMERGLGNLSHGLALLKRSLEIMERGSTYNNLAALYFQVGDYKSGEEYTKKGIRHCNKLIRAGHKGRGGIPGSTLPKQ